MAPSQSKPSSFCRLQSLEKSLETKQASVDTSKLVFWVDLRREMKPDFDPEVGLEREQLFLRPEETGPELGPDLGTELERPCDGHGAEAGTL